MSKTFLKVCSLSNICHEPVAMFDFHLVEHIGQLLVQHKLRTLQHVLDVLAQDPMRDALVNMCLNAQLKKTNKIF